MANISYIAYSSIYIVYFFLLYFLIGVFIKVSQRLQLVDTPNERSNHKIPVPRGAGIVIIFAMNALLFVFAVYNNYFNAQILSLIISLLFIASVFFVEDIITLKIHYRLISQILVVAFGMYFILGKEVIIFPYLPDFINYIIVFISWLWFINLYNFMDGIDGITATETIAICFGVILISHHLQQIIPIEIATIIIVSMIVFLLFNWSPAKVFIGDGGSVALGFLIGLLLIRIAHFTNVLVSITLALYYLSDSGITIVKRMMKGEAIWLAHSDHFYQKAIRKGMSAKLIVCLISIVNLCLIGFALIMIKINIFIIIPIFILSLLLIWAILKIFS